MIPRISLAAMCAAIFMLSACDLGPPQLPPPEQGGDSDAVVAAASTTNLTPDQLNGVLGCQQTIQFQGIVFTTLEESALNECLDGALRVQLGYENGQLASNQYSQELTTVRADCARQFKTIGAASTALVNNIAGACIPVQSLILPNSGYDPLQFGALTRSQNIDLAGNATGLAGAICGAKDLFVDALVDIQLPRMVGLLKILDNGTGQFAAAGPTSNLLPASTIPNVPLDSRCSFPTLPQ
jgi:hypothetical protein